MGEAVSYRDDWDLRSRARAWVVRLCLRVISWVAPHRNESLSWHLHQFADRYSKRPEGRWEKP